jgi:hypothetical protein
LHTARLELSLLRFRTKLICEAKQIEVVIRGDEVSFEEKLA